MCLPINLLRIQEAGTAVPNDITLRSKYCLRAAINNHRTQRKDLDLLVAETIRIGEELQESM